MHITTIGGATIDIVVSGSRLSTTSGNKQDVESITMGIGGGAVNASLAFQACDANVRIVCALGCDTESLWLRTALQRESIDLSLIQSIADHPTGKSVVFLDGSEAHVFAQRGASTHVAPARVVDAAGCTDLLYVTALSPAAELEFSTALRHRSSHFPLIAINPSMRQLATASSAGEYLLSQANLICFNEAEARMLAAKLGGQIPSDILKDGALWMNDIRLHSSQAMLVTLGSRGALFHDGYEIHFMPAEHVSVESTLGAGDAFGATLAFYWAKGYPATAALEAARAYCAKVLQKITTNLAGSKHTDLQS